MGPVFPRGPRTAVTLTWLGGVLAIIGGALWIIAAIVNPGGVVWPIFAATLSVGTIVIARSLGSRAGFWGWLAVRGFAVGLVGVVAGQMIGGNLGTPISVAALVLVWLAGLFAAIGVRSSGGAGRLGPTLAIAGWFLIYLTFMLPLGSWLVAPYGAGWILTGAHLIRIAHRPSR